MREHRDAAIIEDALFLLETGSDLSEVAARVGIRRESLEKKIERHRKRAER